MLPKEASNKTKTQAELEAEAKRGLDHKSAVNPGRYVSGEPILIGPKNTSETPKNATIPNFQSSPTVQQPAPTPQPTAPKTSAPSTTRIVMKDGSEGIGYIIDGQTYVDPEGKQRISDGTSVYTAGGWYKYDNGQSYKAFDPRKQSNNDDSYYDDIVGSIIGRSSGMSASDVYDQFIKILNEKPKMGEVMGDGEAQARARNQFNTQYEKAMDDQMRNIDINALRSGFYGQLPTEQLRANAAASVEAQKESAIQQSSSDMIKNSRDAAQQQFNNEMNVRGQQASILSNAISSYAALDQNELSRLSTAHGIANDKRSQDRADADLAFRKEQSGKEYDLQKDKFEFDKALAKADMFGTYEGMDTLQKKQIDANIAQGWASVNARNASGSGSAESKESYAADIYNNATEMAMNYFKNVYGTVDPINGIEGNDELKNEFFDMVNYYVEYLTSGSGAGTLRSAGFTQPTSQTASNFKQDDYSQSR